MFQKYLAAAAALLCAGIAHAQPGVSVDFGSTGAGLHLVVPMESSLNGRFGINYLRHDFDRRSGQVDYAVKGKLQTFDILFDWYLREGSAFHLTGGLVYNGNRFDVAAQGTDGKLTLNGHAYNALDVGVLKGHVDFRKAAPYLGIGWGNALAGAQRLSFNADLGAFYQGHPNLTLGGYGCTISKTVCDAVAKDIAVERLRLQDELGSFKLYPVARASVSYRF